MRVGRVQPHDPLIFLAPPLLHLLELGLADHILDAGSEVARHAAHAPDPIADGPQHLGQVLRADEDQREDGDDRQLGGIDAEHGELEVLAGFVVSRRRRRRNGLGGPRA